MIATPLAHSERRPPNIYSQVEINLYCIIKLATEISLFLLEINLMFCVDKIKYENFAILSNLKSCQFAPRIVIFNLWICCQFENSQIIWPKKIPMSHCNIYLWQMRVHFLQIFSFFLLVHKSEVLENIIKNKLLYQTTFWCGIYSTEWVRTATSNIVANQEAEFQLLSWKLPSLQSNYQSNFWWNGAQKFDLLQLKFVNVLQCVSK